MALCREDAELEREIEAIVAAVEDVITLSGAGPEYRAPAARRWKPRPKTLGRVLDTGWDALGNLSGSASERDEIAPFRKRVALLRAMAVVETAAAELGRDFEVL